MGALRLQSIPTKSRGFLKSLAEQPPAADAFQPLLVPRSGFQAWLTAGVDMTSDVKGWEQLFYVRIRVFSLCLSEEPEPVRHDG